MKKIVLVVPCFDKNMEAGKNKKINIKRLLNRVPPLGVMYIASYLEEKGYDVKIIDGSLGIPNPKILQILKKEHPDYIGMSILTPLFGSAVNLAKKIKENLDSIIIAGGPHVSALPKETLAYSCFDYAILGEGEFAFAKLLKALEEKEASRKTSLSKIKGIALRNKSGIKVTPGREVIKNLDDLPFPAYHLIRPLRYYHPTPASYKKLPQAMVMTSRGCPYQCGYCDKGVFLGNYRERSAENVVDEIEWLVKKYKVRDIRFFDDTFTLNKKRMYKILDLMKQRELKLPLGCLTRVDCIDREMLIRMKKAGCWQLLFGIESFDKKLLADLKKGVTVEQNINAIKLAQSLGFSIRADLLFGTPTDSIAQMEKTIEIIKKLNPDYAHFNKFTPYPGSKIYQDLTKQGYKFDFTKRSSQLDHSSFIYLPPGISKKEYAELLNKAYREYYIRFRYFVKMFFSIRSFSDVKKYAQGFLSFLGI